MRLSDLAQPTIEALRRYRYDRILEKHEGPESWASVLEYSEPDFLLIEGFPVLLPVNRDQHPNITVLRCIVADDANVLTLFLRNTTHGNEWYDSGFLAVCERMPGQDFFVATVYHEWFVSQNP